MKDFKYYRGLCVKAIIGDIQANEKRKLNDWLLRSDDNKREYDKLRVIWQNSIPESEPILPEIDSEWDALNRRLEKDETMRRKHFPQFDRFKHSLIFGLRLKPALAGTVILIVLAFGLFLLNRQNQIRPQNIIVSTERENKTVKLSDGSTIILNSSSRLEYIEQFDAKAREIKLSGEGYFTVIHENRPFIITTDNARITVVGTKFSVNSYNDKTSVVVREGHVRLSQNKTYAREIDLLKGQRSIVIKNHEPSAPTDVNADYLLDWINGKFVYDRASLSEIADQLGKYYNVKLTIPDDKIKNLTLTGAFSKSNLDSIVFALCLANGLICKKEKEGYLIMQSSGSQ